MRFKRKYPTGKKVIKRWFAIVPVYIGNDIRWLEFVRVEGSYDFRRKFIKDRFVD